MVLLQHAGPGQDRGAPAVLHPPLLPSNTSTSTLPLRTRYHPEFMVLLEHAGPGEDRGAPAVLQPLGQRGLLGVGDLGRAVREAVVVVGVEELREVPGPVTVLPAVPTRHYQLLHDKHDNG